jgi:hypothetical protein
VAAPSFGQACTFTAACCLVVTAGMYMIAAYKGEVWIDPKAGSGGDDGGRGGAKRGKGGMVVGDRTSSRPGSRAPVRQRPVSEVEWQTNALAAPTQTDAQGYAVTAPGPRNSNTNSSANLLRSGGAGPSSASMA